MKHRYLWFNSIGLTLTILISMVFLIVYLSLKSDILAVVLAFTISFSSLFFLITKSKDTRSLVYSSALSCGVVFSLSYQVWILFLWPPTLWKTLASWSLFILLATTLYEVVYYLTDIELRMRFMSEYRFVYAILAILSCLLLLWVRFNITWLWWIIAVLTLAWFINTYLMIRKLSHY